MHPFFWSATQPHASHRILRWQDTVHIKQTQIAQAAIHILPMGMKQLVGAFLLAPSATATPHTSLAESP